VSIIRGYMKLLLSTGMDKLAIWTLGWSIAWTLYVLLRLLFPELLTGSIFGIILFVSFTFLTFIGLATLSLLRNSASQAQNPARVRQLVNLSYNVFGIGFLALILSAILWVIDVMSTR
jgi:hypothetical protein